MVRHPNPKSQPIAKSPLASHFRHIKPNWRHYIDLVKISSQENNETAKKLISIYNDLSASERKSISPEQLCDLAEIQPSKLFSIVAEQLFEQSSRESNLLLAMEKPKVLEKLAKSAKSPKNPKHTEMFLKGTGFLPTGGGGNSVVVNNRPQIANITSGSSGINQLPSMDDDILELNDIDGQLQLES